MVGRVPAFQPGGPGSILGGCRNFNFCPGIGCVSFVCVLSCVVFGGGPEIVLTTDSGRPERKKGINGTACTQNDRISLYL